jgi:hypothetical protein
VLPYPLKSGRHQADPPRRKGNTAMSQLSALQLPRQKVEDFTRLATLLQNLATNRAVGSCSRRSSPLCRRPQECFHRAFKRQLKPGQYLKVYFARIQAEAVPTT